MTTIITRATMGVSRGDHEREAKMFKLYGTDDQGQSLRLHGHYQHVDDAAGSAEYAFESLEWLAKVEVYDDFRFYPVVRVSEEGIKDLVSPY